MDVDGGEYSICGYRGIGFGGHVCRARFLCETALGNFRVGDAIENGTRQGRAPLRALARTGAPAERPVSLDDHDLGGVFSGRAQREMPKYNSTTACTNSRFHVVNPLRTSSWTSNSIRRRAKRIRRNMGSILSKRSNSGNPNTFCSVPKMYWRSDTWLSVGVAPSTGRQLSPIAGEQFGLLVLGNPLYARSRRMRKSQDKVT